MWTSHSFSDAPSLCLALSLPLVSVPLAFPPLSPSSAGPGHSGCAPPEEGSVAGAMHRPARARTLSMVEAVCSWRWKPSLPAAAVMAPGNAPISSYYAWPPSPTSSMVLLHRRGRRGSPPPPRAAWISSSSVALSSPSLAPRAGPVFSGAARIRRVEWWI